MTTVNNEKPICFFDSGVGGLSVYSLFKKYLPNENTMYFGDTKNLPYGNKSQEELICFAKQILNFFSKSNPKAVIIACNTSSALAYDAIKDSYNFKIYPIIQSCAKVLANMDIKKLCILATLGTINSHAYSKEILKYNPNIKIKEIACPNWVNIVESNLMNTEFAKDDVLSVLKQTDDFQPEKIVLGCTHYPYLLNILKNFKDKDMFLNPAGIFVDYIKQDLKGHNLVNNSDKIGTEKFFVTSSPSDFVSNAKIFYDIQNTPVLV